MHKRKTNLEVKYLTSNNSVSTKYQDVLLVNPIGSVIDNQKSIWVANNGSKVITHYTNCGEKIIPLSVAVPSPLGGVYGPTGLIYNKSTGFVIGALPNSASSFLIVCTEDGTVAGYNPLVDPLNAITMIDNSATNAVYRGIAQADNKIYVADFFNNKIDVFDYNWVPLVGFPFIDQYIPNPIPAGYAPFNIVKFNDYLYVMYAKQTTPPTKDSEKGEGFGYISVFNLDGTFVKRFVSGGKLNSPWGMTYYNHKHCGYFLVGNNGNGTINIYNSSGHFITKLKDKYCDVIILDGLWDLNKFKDTIYFTAGSSNGVNGLLGSIAPIEK